MVGEIVVIDGGCVHPTRGAAMDEHLLEKARRDGRSYAMVYTRDRPTVSLGYRAVIRDQVDLDNGLIEDMVIIRRRSSGGTIITGPGVIVFALVSSSSILRYPSRAFKSVCQSVSSAIEEITGSRASFKPPNDVLLNGHKVSGSAQLRTGREILHQGTLIVSLDARYLDVLKRHSGALSPVWSLEGLMERRYEMDHCREVLLRHVSNVLGDRRIEAGFTSDDEESISELMVHHLDPAWIRRK